MTETCYGCGRGYEVVYRVPDDVWRQISPKPVTRDSAPDGGLLCVDCAWIRAKDKGIHLYFEASIGWWREEEKAKVLVDFAEELNESAESLEKRGALSAANYEYHISNMAYQKAKAIREGRE